MVREISRNPRVPGSILPAGHKIADYINYLTMNVVAIVAPWVSGLSLSLRLVLISVGAFLDDQAS